MYAEKFKIRCHALGKILGKYSNELTEKQNKELDRLIALKKEKQAEGGDITPTQNKTVIKGLTKRNSKPELPTTCKTYLKEWLITAKRKKKKGFSNKFTEKGIAVEQNVIDLYSRITGREFLVKNEENYENEWMTGTPDVVTDIIVDVKSSWDIFTFGIYDFEVEAKQLILNYDYECQLKGYMILVGRNKAELAYGLVNTPPDLIFKELNKIKWNLSGVLSEEEEDKLEETVTKNMTFEEIPEKLRMKIFKLDLDSEFFESVKKRVIECREYIAELERLEEEKLNN